MLTFEREVSRQVIGSRRRYLPHRSGIPLRVLYLRDVSCKLSYVSTGMVKRGDFDVAIKELVSLLASIALEAGWIKDMRAYKIVVSELGVKETSASSTSQDDLLVFRDEDISSSDEDDEYDQRYVDAQVANASGNVSGNASDSVSNEDDEERIGRAFPSKCEYVRRRRASASMSPLHLKTPKRVWKRTLSAGDEGSIDDPNSTNEDEIEEDDDEDDEDEDDDDDQILEFNKSRRRNEAEQDTPGKRAVPWSTALSARLTKLDIFSDAKFLSSSNRTQSSVSISSMNKSRSVHSRVRPINSQSKSSLKTNSGNTVPERARFIESVIIVLDAILSCFTQYLVELGLVPRSSILPDNTDQQQYTDPLWTTNHWPGVCEVPPLQHPVANALLAIIEELLPSRRSEAVFSSVFDYDGKSQLTNVVMNVAQYLYIANTQLCESRAAAALAGWPGRTRLELLLVVCPNNVAVEHRMKLISSNLHRLDDDQQHELLMHTCSCIVRLISQDPKCKWASARPTRAAIRELINILSKSRALHPFRAFRLADNLIELLLEIVYACAAEGEESHTAGKPSISSWSRVTNKVASSKTVQPWQKCWDRIASAYKKDSQTRTSKEKSKVADCVARVGFIAWIAYEQSAGLSSLFKQVAVSVAEFAPTLCAQANLLSPVVRIEMLVFFSEFAPQAFHTLLPCIVRDRLLLQFLRGVHVFGQTEAFNRVFDVCAADFKQMVSAALDNNNYQTSFAAFDLALDLPTGKSTDILEILTEFNRTRIIVDPFIRELYELFAVHFAKREPEAKRSDALAQLIPICQSSEWLTCPERVRSLLLVLKLLANGRRVVPTSMFETGSLSKVSLSFLELRINLLIGLCNNSKSIVKACLRCLELLQADMNQTCLERDLIAELLDTKMIDDASPGAIRRRFAYLLSTRAKCDIEKCDVFCGKFSKMMEVAIEEKSGLKKLHRSSTETGFTSLSVKSLLLSSPNSTNSAALTSPVPVYAGPFAQTHEDHDHSVCIARQTYKNLVRVRVAAVACNSDEDRKNIYKFVFYTDTWLLSSIVGFVDLLPEIALEFYIYILELVFETSQPSRAQLALINWLLKCIAVDVRDKTTSEVLLLSTPQELCISTLGCYIVEKLRPTASALDERAVLKLLEQCARLVAAKDIELGSVSMAKIFRPVIKCMLNRKWKCTEDLMKTFQHLFDAYIEPDVSTITELLSSLTTRFKFDESYGALSTLLHANLNYALRLCGVGCPSSECWRKRISAYSALSWHYAQTYTTSGFVLESSDFVNFMLKYPAVLFALCDVCSIDGNDSVAGCLLSLFKSFSPLSEVNLVEMMLDHEINTVTSCSQLFRTNSVPVQIIVRWIKQNASQYNTDVLLPAVSILRAASMRDNCYETNQLFEQALSSLRTPKLPDPLAWFYKRVIAEVTKKFNSAIAETAVSVLAVLRCLCPSLLGLKGSGIVDRAPSREMAQFLRKFAVYLQHKQIDVKNTLFAGLDDNPALTTLKSTVTVLPWQSQQSIPLAKPTVPSPEPKSETELGFNKRESLSSLVDRSTTSRQVFHFLRQHAVEVRIVLQAQNETAAIKELHRFLKLGKHASSSGSSSRSYMSFGKPIKFMNRSSILFNAAEVVSSVATHFEAVSKEISAYEARPLVLDFTQSSHLIGKWEEIFFSARQAVFNRVTLVMLNCPQQLFDAATAAKRENKLECPIYFVSSSIEAHRKLFDYLPQRAMDAVADLNNSVPFQCTLLGGLQVTAYVGAQFLQVQARNVLGSMRTPSCTELTGLIIPPEGSTGLREYFNAEEQMKFESPSTPTQKTNTLCPGLYTENQISSIALSDTLDNESTPTQSTPALKESDFDSEKESGSESSVQVTPINTNDEIDTPLVSPLTPYPNNSGRLKNEPKPELHKDGVFASSRSSSASHALATSESPSPAASISSSIVSSPSVSSEYTAQFPLSSDKSFEHVTCNVLSYTVSGSKAVSLLESSDSMTFVCGDASIQFDHPSASFSRILNLSAASADKTISRPLTNRLDELTTGSLLFMSLIDMGSELPEVRKHASELYAIFPYALGLDLRVLSLQECCSFSQIVSLSTEAAELYPTLAKHVINAFVSLGSRIGAHEAQIAAPWLPVLVSECKNKNTIAELKEEVLKPLLVIATTTDDASQPSKCTMNGKWSDTPVRSTPVKFKLSSRGSSFETIEERSEFGDLNEQSCAVALREHFWCAVPGLSNLISDLLVELAISGYDLDMLCQTAATCSSKDGYLDTRRFAKYFLSRLYKALLADDAVPPAPLNTLWSSHARWPEIEACACLFASISMDPENAEHLFIDQAFIVCALAGIGPIRLRVAMRMMFISFVHAFMQSHFLSESDALRVRALRSIHAKLIGPKGKELFGVSEITSMFAKAYTSRLDSKKHSTIAISNLKPADNSDFAYDRFDSFPASTFEELCKLIAETAAVAFGLRTRFQNSYALFGERITLYANDRYPALYRRCVLAVPATARFVMHSTTVGRVMKRMTTMLVTSPLNIQPGLLSAYLHMFSTSIECIPEASGYQQRLFWFACTCLATSNLSIVGESLQLLRQVLKIGHLRGTYRKFMPAELYLKAKPQFLDISRNADGVYSLPLSLPSTEQNFHLSLTSLLIAAMRSVEHRLLVIDCFEVLNTIFPNELVYCLVLLIIRTSGVQSLAVNTSDTFSKDVFAKELAKRIRYEDMRGVVALAIVTQGVLTSGSCIRLLDFISHIKDRRVVSAMEPLLRTSFNKLIEKNDAAMEDRIAEWTLDIFSHSAEQRIAINGHHAALEAALKKFDIKKIDERNVKTDFTEQECKELVGKWYL